MAYESKNLSVMTYANGFTFWHYTTTDAVSDVDTSGYFNDASDMLRVGDVIVINADTDGTPVTGFMKVDSNANGVVDCTDIAQVDAGNSRDVVLSAYLDDISTAGQVYVVSPVAGDISAIYSVIDGAIATADATLTAKIGGTDVTGGAITVTQSGSAAGDVDSATPTAANAVTAGQAIEIETDGASTNTVPVSLTIVITPTADTD